MCSVEQMSSPIVRPWSLPITVSSRQTRTSCSFVRNTSGPMKPATSLRCTHGRPGVPAFARASATVAASARAKPYLRDSWITMSKPLPWPLVASAPWPVSKYRPKRPVRVAACPRIFATSMSNTALASATPARLWNQSAVDPGDLLLDRGLHVDVRQHAVRQHLVEGEGLQQVAQRHFDRGHLIDVARHRVGAEHHVADRVGPAVEHLQDDVLGIVGRRVGLDARAHVAPGADVRSRQRVEDLAAHRDQLVVGHQLDRAGDDVARQARHDRLDRVLGLAQQEPHQLADRPRLDAARGPTGRPARPRSARPRRRRSGAPGATGWWCWRGAAGCCSRDGSSAAARPCAGVTLLEGIGGAEHAAVFDDVVAAVHALQPREDVLGIPDVGNRHALGRGRGRGRHAAER